MSRKEIGGRREEEEGARARRKEGGVREEERKKARRKKKDRKKKEQLRKEGGKKRKKRGEKQHKGRDISSDLTRQRAMVSIDHMSHDSSSGPQGSAGQDWAFHEVRLLAAAVSNPKKCSSKSSM